MNDGASSGAPVVDNRVEKRFLCWRITFHELSTSIDFRKPRRIDFAETGSRRSHQPSIGQSDGDVARRSERQSSVYCVEKLGIEMTVSSPEFSMRLSFAALDFSERVVLVALHSSES